MAPSPADIGANERLDIWVHGRCVRVRARLTNRAPQRARCACGANMEGCGAAGIRHGTMVKETGDQSGHEKSHTLFTAECASHANVPSRARCCARASKQAMQHAFELGFEWSRAAPPPGRRPLPRHQCADTDAATDDRRRRRSCGGSRCHFPFRQRCHISLAGAIDCCRYPSPRHVSICGRFVRETNTRVCISSAPLVASSRVHSLRRPPRRHRHARQIG
jgi:hypothetical protein